MPHEFRLRFDSAIGMPQFVVKCTIHRLKYSLSAYNTAAVMFSQMWDALCADTPVKGPFKIQEVRRKNLALFTNKDLFAAFVHLASAVRGGNWISKVGGGRYQWEPED